MTIYVRLFQSKDSSTTNPTQADCAHASRSEAEQCLARSVLDEFNESVEPSDNYESEDGDMLWIEAIELDD